MYHGSAPVKRQARQPGQKDPWYSTKWPPRDSAIAMVVDVSLFAYRGFRQRPGDAAGAISRRKAMTLNGAGARQDRQGQAAPGVAPAHLASARSSTHLRRRLQLATPPLPHSRIPETRTQPHPTARYTQSHPAVVIVSAVQKLCGVRLDPGRF